MLRYTTQGLKNALLAGIAGGVCVSGAWAQVGDAKPQAPLKMQTDYFGYSAGVSGRVFYTDNLNLSGDGQKESEVIFSSVLSGGAIISKPAVTALVLGDLDFSYLVDQGEFVINQDIGATSTFTAVDDWLYLDVSGRTSRQLIGDNARFSRSVNSGRGQQANVHSYNLSPYLYHQMADQSSVELRYRWSQVFVTDQDSDYNPFNGNYLNDSKSHEAFASYDSGGFSDTVRFRLSAYGNKTVESGSIVLPDFEYEHGAVYSDFQYALNTKLSLSGAIGYDEVNTGGAASFFFDDSELSGFFWRAGFTSRPNRRSRIRIEYGKRYDDDFVDADMFYEIGKRIVATAGVSRVLQTRAQGVGAQYRSVQTQTLNFADRIRQGGEISPRGVIEAANRFENIMSGDSRQSVGVSVSNQAFASLSGNFKRTNVALRANYEDHDYGFRQVEAYGVDIEARRRISRRLNGYAGLNYRRSDTEFDPSACEAYPVIFGFDVDDPFFDPVSDCAALASDSGVTNTVIGRVGADYQLYKNVRSFAEVSHTKRFSPVERQEYDENTIMMGLTLDF